MTEPDRTGFGRRILDTFADSFCQKVDIAYDPNGYRYTLQVHSEQIKCLSPRPIASAARDAADAAPADRKRGEARAVTQLVRRDASEAAPEN